MEKDNKELITRVSKKPHHNNNFIDNNNNNNMKEVEEDKAFLTRSSKKPRLEQSHKRASSLFDKLPNELVVRILSHFKLSFVATILSLVSKRFRNLSLDSSLWTELPNPIPENIDIKIKFRLVRRCNQLKELDLSHGVASTFLAVTALESSSKLEKLSINQPSDQAIIANIDILLYTVEKFRRTSLKSLKLSGTWNEMAFVTKAGALPNLTTLVLDGHKGLNFAADLMEAIGNNCSKLEVFKLITHVPKGAVSPEIMDAFFDGALKDTLREIWIELVNLAGKGSLRSVWKCRHLRILHIESSLEELCRADFQAISKLAKLEHLSLSKCMRVTATSADVSLAFAKQKLSNITYLDLCFLQIIEDDAVCTIAENCPKLSFLDLCWCWNITNVGVKRLMQECGELKSFALMDNPNVTIEAFIDGKAKLKNLMWQDFSGNYSQEEEEEFERLLPGINLCHGWMDLQ